MTEGSWGRIVGILVSPIQTSRSIAERASWLAPVIVLLLVTAGFTALATPKLDLEPSMRRSIEQRGQELDEEQVERMLTVAERFKWVGGAAGVVLSLASCFLLALVFWCLFRLVGGEFDYRTSLGITAHSFLPLGLAALLAVPVLLSRSVVSPEELQAGLIASNPAFFLDDAASKPLRAVLASLDLFKLWVAALLGIGYGIVAKVKRSKALWSVAGLWAVWIAIKAGLAALFG